MQLPQLPQPWQPQQLGHLQQRGKQHLEQQRAQGQQQHPGLQQPFSGSYGHAKSRETG